MRSAVAGRAAVWFLLILAVAGAAGYVWYARPELVPAPLRRVAPASPHGPALYKWRDAKGALHVTDTAPTDRPYETVRYDPNVNVVPPAAGAKHE